MFESYKVAVKISLVSNVAKELGAMSVLFGKLGKDVDALNLKLKSLKRVGIAGGVIAGAGFLGLDLFSKALKPAEEYTHQLNKMNMAGMKHKEIAEATGAAWKVAGQVLTSTPTSNLKSFIDLRSVFGNTQMALQYMPTIAKLATVIRSAGDQNISTDDVAFSVAKALDIRGAIKNPQEFNREAQGMAKVITAFQARILPKDYQQFFKYARGATLGLSDQFLYKELPTFMLMMKGSGGGGSSGGMGAPIYALYRFLVQGVMTKTALAGMQSIGLVAQNAGLRTTTTGTMLKLGQHVKDVQLAAYDPFQYVQQVMLPAIEKKYGYNLTKTQLGTVISQVMKGASANAIFSVTQFAEKGYNVKRDERLIAMAKAGNTAFNMAMSSDPTTAMAAFTAQWTAFKIALAQGVIPIIVPALINLSKWLNVLGEWARSHPNLMKVLGSGFLILSGVLVVLGSGILLGAAAGIWRLNAAITVLNKTLASGAVAGAGSGVAGEAAAGLGVVGSLAVGAGLAASVGLAAYGGYKAYETFKNINYHELWRQLGNANQLFDPSYGAMQNNQKNSVLQNELNNFGVTQVPASRHSPQTIVLQVDGKTLGQVVADYFNQSMYHAQIQQSNNYMVNQIPPMVGTGPWF